MLALGFFLLIGLLVLIIGAELLIKGSASLARRLGVTPLVIGLTIVAFGTSSPELIVNLFAAFKGSTEMAIGNIVGSNISNVFLILGISAIIYPLSVKGTTVWREIPFALLAMLLLYLIGNDALFDSLPFNLISRTDGFSLLAFFIIFLFYVFGVAKNKGEAEKITTYSHFLSSLFVLFGIIFLFIGGSFLVDNAVKIAQILGLSETFMGLTILAVGTSLPELVTSIIASIHKEHEIAIGNIIGSSIFNIFWILGVTAIISPLPVDPKINIDMFVGIIAMFLLFIYMFIGKKHVLDRWQGILFILLYLGYLGFIFYRG
ncbi:sodium:proton exchanger [Candidatus Uhrbacteria bacterium CG_4_9_14_3_um_filter_36_7]|uniref:Sodium:proton exchanger n=1 Tax=Candidatus Uhrbacteria bacterium CG_4_9_14_3_um_filter_36_7 TaxID=1975033 RepID=A0A2M7XH65_9BACT|nr:MAG: sodium:proton exchanger [Candidatus Uhrbacteria bacterium CG_4_9_14_3_um_filter_36_7]